MGSNHTVWSIATSQHASHSLCKRAPLQCITSLWPQPLVKQDQQQGQQKALADQQWRQLDFKHSQQDTVQWLDCNSKQRQSVKRSQPAKILGFCGDSYRQEQHHDVHPAHQDGSSHTAARRSGGRLVGSEQPDGAQLPQWQLVPCSVHDLAAAAWLCRGGGGSTNDAPAQQPPASRASNSNVQGGKGADVHHRGRAAAQPAALNHLMVVAKCKQPVAAAGMSRTLHQVQLLMPQLPLYQLAYAAWAAAELSHQQAPSQRWLQQLLTSAEQHFQQPSTIVDEAAVVTLLQALVTLEHLPGRDWLAGCCASLALEHWCSPRALSTLAACLPQLGYVPSRELCSSFYAASAACLSSFPVISAARMLHGVTAWQHLQHQRQQHLVPVHEPWLLQVLQHVHAHSSQLKPAEIAMVLQALQRLQTAYSSQHQVVGQLLPAPGQQPATPLQQLSQQLLHALLGAVLQQLPRFKAKDMTVMLFSVASLSQQQPAGLPPQSQHQPVVQWSWLQRVLTAVQFQHLDARGQATCLTAAVMLIKQHLQLQVQQQRHMELHEKHNVQSLNQQQTGPSMVKPLQRWIQLQQQQAQAATGPSVAAVQPLSQLASRASTEFVMSRWQQWLGSFFRHSVDQLVLYSCEDLTVSLCALASMRQVPPVGWYEAVLEAVQQQLPLMSPGQAAGIARALGTMALLPSQHDCSVSLVPGEAWLRGLYPAVTDAHETDTVAQTAAAGGSTVNFGVSSCSASEVIRLMWSAGVCEFEPGVAWWTAAQSQLLRCAAVGQEAGTARSRQQQQLSVQLLCQLAQAYAAAGRRMPTNVLQQLVISPAVLQQLLLPAPANSITALLKALRQCMGVVPAEWLQQLATGLQQRFVQLEAKDLLQLLDGLAGAGLRAEHQQAPDADQQGTLLDNGATRGAAATALSWQAPDGNNWSSTCLLVTQQHMQQLSASDVSFLMRTLVKLQAKPPASWLRAALLRLQTGFLDAKPACLGAAITALSKLGYMPPADWLAGFMMATHRKTAAMAADPDSDKLALARFILMTLWALADMKLQPLHPKWLKLMLVTVYQQLPLLQPKYSLSLLQVLARLRCRPTPKLLQNLLDRIGDCSRCSSADLVRVVYAAASLRWQPNRVWCRMFLSASAEKLAELDLQGLALVHWSLAVMRLTPPDSWKSAAVSAVMLRLADFKSADLSMVIWSWGRMMVHLTPQQQSQKAQRCQQQRQWKQQLQQLFKEQRQKQLGVQQLGPEQQWMQQQWQEWKQQKQKQQMLQPLRTNSAHFSRLKQPEQVSHKLLAAAGSLQGTYSMPNLVYLLVGVARLQLRPSQEWLQALVLHGSCDKLSVLNGLQLQQLLWALAMLGYRAEWQWLATVSVLLEVSWQENDYIRHSAAAAFARLQQLAPSWDW